MIKPIPGLFKFFVDDDIPKEEYDIVCNVYAEDFYKRRRHELGHAYILRLFGLKSVICISARYLLDGNNLCSLHISFCQILNRSSKLKEICASIINILYDIVYDVFDIKLSIDNLRGNCRPRYLKLFKQLFTEIDTILKNHYNAPGFFANSKTELIKKLDEHLDEELRLSEHLEYKQMI